MIQSTSCRNADEIKLRGLSELAFTLRKNPHFLISMKESSTNPSDFAMSAEH